MILIETTPNNAGVTIQGDYWDFDQLYNAIHETVGDDGEYEAYSATRLRVLALCYDLRHARMGDREFTFVSNGLTDETRLWRGIVAPDMNLYLSILVLWPELLFYALALNDFAELRAAKLSRDSYNPFENGNVIWDASLAQVRMFQAAVWSCIERTVPPTVLGRIRNLMLHSRTSYANYATQYLDVLNIRFLKLNSEKRVKNISIMAKRLVEMDDEYWGYWNGINRAARAYGCAPEDIRLQIEYPEEIDW